MCIVQQGYSSQGIGTDVQQGYCGQGIGTDVQQGYSGQGIGPDVQQGYSGQGIEDYNVKSVGLMCGNGQGMGLTWAQGQACFVFMAREYIQGGL